MAFISTGYTHFSEDQLPSSTIRPGDTVKAGLKWLVARQGSDGYFRPSGDKPMYEHILATLAVVEAYGMIGSNALQRPAQLAIDYVLKAQAPQSGWKYTQHAETCSTFVTAWAVLAIESAKRAGILTDTQVACSGALKWLDRITDPTVYYRAGDESKKPDHRFRLEGFAFQETPTAMAVLTRLLIGKTQTHSTRTAVGLVGRGQPQWKEWEIDFTYWHFGTMAMWHHWGIAEEPWKQWKRSLHDALLPNQVRGEGQCAQGSWDPEVELRARDGGRVYATAINILTLETCYRYARWVK